MISLFRRALSSWLALGLLGLVLVAFVVTGIHDPFGGSSNNAGGPVAEVAKRKISANELLDQFERLMRRMRQEQPKITNEQAVREGALDQVLDQIISGAALEEFGRDIGLHVSHRLIDKEIAAIPAFQGPSGQFDQTIYRQTLAAQRMTDRQLRDSFSGDLLRRQLLDPMLLGADTPPAMVMPFVKLLLEERRANIALVPAEAYPAPAPNDAALASYYRANIARYTIPERRSFTYAFLDKAEIARNLKISDAEIAKYYQDNAADYAGKQKRSLSQAVLSDEKTARALVARVRSGEAFAKAANALGGFSAEDLAIGTQTREEFASATNVAVASAAFAAAQGAVTEPVKSDFGWHVVYVDAIQNLPGKSLAAVRGEIVATLTRTQAEDNYADLTSQIEDAIDAGESLSDVAKSFKLTLVTVPPITRDGQVAGNTPPFNADARLAGVLGKIFSLDASDGAVVEPLSDSLAAVIAIGDIVPPTPVALADIKARVSVDWQRNAQNLRAKQVGQSILAELKKGSSLAQALAGRNLPPARPVAGRRIDVMRQPNVPAPVMAVFSLPRDGAQLIEVPGQGGYFVVKLENIIPAQGTPDPQLVAAVRAEMSRGATEELGAAFARAVEREMDTKRNPSALKAVKQRYIGAATNSAE